MFYLVFFLFPMIPNILLESIEIAIPSPNHFIAPLIRALGSLDLITSKSSFELSSTVSKVYL